MIKFEFASWISLGAGICQLILCALTPSPRDLPVIYLAALFVAVGIAGLVYSLFNRDTGWDQE